MSAAHEQNEADSIRDVVAIDGPAGAGKSTVARALARRLGWAYLDTGALFRATTWFLLDRGVAIDQPEAVAAAVEGLQLEVTPAGRFAVNAVDVTDLIRTQVIDGTVSQVAAQPAVRATMRVLQRAIAARGPVVAEGRDMASVVFPAARWKIYIDASEEERARRRRRDFLASGREVSAGEVEQEIHKRDTLDRSRREAPLRRTEDAVYLDTTGMSIDEVVERLAAMVASDAGPDGAGGGGDR